MVGAPAVCAAGDEKVAQDAPKRDAQKEQGTKKAKAAKKKTEAAEGEKPIKRGKVPLPQNALFEQCHRGRIVPDEEWSDFMASLQKDLPCTFRFEVAHPLSSSLAGYLEKEFLVPGALQEDEDLRDNAVDTNGCAAEPAAAGFAPIPREPLASVPWSARTWKVDIPKAQLRKAAGPKRLHSLMKRCTELGAISRQELVSMVPAILLEARSGMRVLDMCASPGMKTLQLIDSLADGAAGDPSAAAAWLRGAGVVAGNELDGRRCCMLAHHVLRARSPAGLVLHHDAGALPALGAQFDRVLCDVPCSGDGTIRKAPQLMGSWKPNKAIALHSLQLRIACAGAARVACGGRMVYSTCSMSPVENEAVVAALLQRARGGLELVDCAGELAGCERRPGLASWEVPAGARQARAAVFLKSPAEAAARGLDLPASAWPPAGPEAADLGLPAVLQRCWRFYPHLGDSGGFFVAVLQRTEKALPDNFVPDAACQVPEAGDGDDKAEDDDAVCKEAIPDAQREDNYSLPSQRTRELIQEALHFYGLEGLPVDNFFVRNEGEGRNVYLVSDAVRETLLASAAPGEKASGARALVAGVRVFDENRFLKSSKCTMRLCQEGIHWLAPAMRRRVCDASVDEMLQLLEGAKVSFTELAEDSALRIALQSLDAQGSVVVTCRLPGAGRVAIAAERGAECLMAFVNKQELRELREALRELLAVQ